MRCSGFGELGPSLFQVDALPLALTCASLMAPARGKAQCERSVIETDIGNTELPGSRSDGLYNLQFRTPRKTVTSSVCYKANHQVTAYTSTRACLVGQRFPRQPSDFIASSRAYARLAVFIGTHHEQTNRLIEVISKLSHCNSRCRSRGTYPCSCSAYSWNSSDDL